MPGLYLPNGDFVEFGEGRDLKSLVAEIATASAMGDMDAGDMLAALPDPDPVLRKRGDDAKVLEDLSSDDQVCTAIQARKTRVLNQRDYDFRPGVLPGKEASPQAAKLCEEITQDLEDIPLRDVFSAILDVPYYGYTPLELMWEAEGGRYRLSGIVAKPRGWFTFNKTGQPLLKPNNGEPKPLPWGKFLFPRHFPTYDNPYGLRLLSRCLWPVAFKRGGVRFFTRFLDRYGMPWTLGKAPQGADQTAKKIMAADLAAMVQDAVAVIPYGSEVELVESKGSAGGQFELYLKRWDKAILKVIMGQTLTAEMDGQGSRAAAQVHKAVAEDLAEADQYIIESTMNDLAVIYREINAPDVEAPVFGFNEPDDYDAQADLDTKLYNVGVRFKPAHFERRYGLQPDEFSVTAENGGAEPDGSGQGESFAEGDDHQELLDRLVEAILPQAAKQNQTFMAKLLDLLDRAESFEEMQLLLAEHLGADLDQKEQEDLLTDLMAAAALLGSAAVAYESGSADES